VGHPQAHCLNDRVSSDYQVAIMVTIWSSVLKLGLETRIVS